MKKLTLSLLMLLMHYQGNKGKYYTIQRVSIGISTFTSIFVTGFLEKLDGQEWVTKGYFFYVCLWIVSFIAHYVWFLNGHWKGTYIHYREYKKYLWGFGLFMMLSILVHV